MGTFSRREALLSIGGAALSMAASCEREVPRARTQQPNIIFIMADDLGYADLGCYGARTIRTPHLDQLALEGVRLTEGYANSPVCSATRTALITGKYQYRFRCGLEEPIGPFNIGLPEATPTLPLLLKSLGYRTALVGKWHIGSLPEYSPLKSGYDNFFGIQEGGADYFSHHMVYGPMVSAGLMEGETPIERQGYLTDLLGDRAIAEIEEASARNQPIMLSLHFTAPHWPWEGPEDEEISKLITNATHQDGGSLSTYAKMVERMDENIGKLMAKIKKLGIADNTIVIFTSDNGGERFSDTWPFIGAKTELLEGGIRVPIIMKWPERIKPANESSQVMISMDFAPTLLAAAGANSEMLDGFDGENLLDILTGHSSPRQRTLFWRYNAADQAAIRSGDWKYLKILDREWLFDLSNDQHERANLAEREKGKLRELKAKYEVWNSTMLPYPEDSMSYSLSGMLADRYSVDDGIPK
ncbi:MAG: sulfatase-like hydrolase/transferase [Parvularculaceae bacterium]